MPVVPDVNLERENVENVPPVNDNRHNADVYSAVPTKLISENVPKLTNDPNSNTISARTIVLWMRSFTRWARMNGYAHIIDTRPQDHRNGEEARNYAIRERDLLRYMSAAIIPETLKASLAEASFNTAPDAFNWIRDKWLYGQSETQVMKRELANIKYDEHLGFRVFQQDLLLDPAQ